MIFIFSTRIFYTKISFISIFLSIIILINICFFFEIYSSNEFAFYFLDKEHIFPQNITYIIKFVYILSISITWGFVLNMTYNHFIDKNQFNFDKNKESTINSNDLIIGINSENNSIISIPEKGLYQNMLITRYNWYR